LLPREDHRTLTRLGGLPAEDGRLLVSDEVLVSSENGSQRIHKLRRSADSAYRAVGDEGGLVVLPIRSEVKVLNPVGSKIYSLLDGNHTERQIIDAVVAEFDISPVEAARDLREFLQELEEHGMLAAETAEPREDA
jgi:hypothetical protein